MKEKADIAEALAELRALAGRFDERLTEMRTVQLKLLKLLRKFDPDLDDRTGPSTATELVEEIRSLSVELRRYTDQNAASPGEEQHAWVRSSTVPQRAIRDLTPDSVLVDFNSLDYRIGFRRLAELVEYVYEHDRLSAWEGVRVRDILERMLHVGRAHSVGLLEDAELPADVTVAQLGSGDVPRLLTVLRQYAGRGLPRQASRRDSG